MKGLPMLLFTDPWQNALGFYIIKPGFHWTQAYSLYIIIQYCSILILRKFFPRKNEIVII